MVLQLFFPFDFLLRFFGSFDRRAVVKIIADEAVSMEERSGTAWIKWQASKL